MAVVKDKKYASLKVDPKISGQKLALVSFVKPQNKQLVEKLEEQVSQAFILHYVDMFQKTRYHMDNKQEDVVGSEAKRYISNDPKVVLELFDEYRQSHFNDIREKFNQDDNDYDELTVTGFKVRGVFSNPTEASDKAKELQNFEEFTNILVAPVGLWVPYNPVSTWGVKSEYNDNGEGNLDVLTELVNKEVEKHKEGKKQFIQRIEEARREEEKGKKEKLKTVTLEMDEESDVEDLPEPVEAAPTPVVDDKKKPKVNPARREKKEKKAKKGGRKKQSKK